MFLLSVWGNLTTAGCCCILTHKRSAEKRQISAYLKGYKPHKFDAALVLEGVMPLIVATPEVGGASAARERPSGDS